jgi:hypothetical protein
MKPLPLFQLLLLAAGSSQVFAGPLKDARINHAINDVRVVDRARGTHFASAQEVLADGSTLCTGPGSRAEIVFADQTIARVGAETSLRVKPGVRGFVLDRGTLLLQVPGFRGGARIETGSLTAVLGGATVLVEHLPPLNLKIVVLEGDTRVRINEFLGDSLVLEPGKMLLAKPDVRQVPTPVDVDLRQLVTTSALVDPAAFRGQSPMTIAPLPSWPRVEKAIDRQAALLKRKTLFRTNLAFLGSGAKMVILTGTPAAASSRQGTSDAPAASLPVANPSDPQRLTAHRRLTGDQAESIALPDQ